MIELYTTHCPKCKVLETKLNQKKISYTIIDDEEEIMATGILSVPYLNVDGKMMDFTAANKWVNEQEVQP